MAFYDNGYICTAQTARGRRPKDKSQLHKVFVVYQGKGNGIVALGKNVISFPQEMVGLKVRFAVEIVDDLRMWEDD